MLFVTHTKYKNWKTFVERISSPLKIYLYSVNQLDLLFKNKGRLLKMSKKTLFFDATGSVVEKIDRESKRIFFYSLILHTRDEKENVGILMPKAETFSCNHYSDDILRFLLPLKTYCQQHRIRWPALSSRFEERHNNCFHFSFQRHAINFHLLAHMSQIFNATWWKFRISCSAIVL